MALLPNPTVISDIAAVPLQPTIPASATQYNPTLTVVDPINGNYFTATGRDLVTFYCSPAANAPTWSALVTYTQGNVVNLSGTTYIAIANVAANLNQNPTISPAFWVLYVSSTVTMVSAPDACTSRTADFTYTVPDGAIPATGFGPYGHTEFLVLPSSVFTQPNGQVQFKGNSNLLKVWVRSL